MIVWMDIVRRVQRKPEVRMHINQRNRHKYIETWCTTYRVNLVNRMCKAIRCL